MRKFIDIITMILSRIADAFFIICSLICFLGFILLYGCVIWFVSSLAILEFEIPVLYPILKLGSKNGLYIGLIIWFVFCCFLGFITLLDEFKSPSVSSSSSKEKTHSNNSNNEKSYHIDSGFYDGCGNWRTWNEPFQDAKGFWRKPGDSFIDGQGNWHKPGEAWQDSKGNYYQPKQYFRDGKGLWRK